MTTLKILSAGAVKRGVTQIADEFARAAGNKVECEFVAVPELRQRVLAGENADVYVATPAVMDDFAARGRIFPDSRGFVGRSRMGVVVHAEAAMPAIGDTPSFIEVLRHAGAVVYNEASSGLYAAKLIGELELVRELASRIVVVKGGAAVMEYVAARPGAVGLAQISEVMVLIDRGCAVKLAAPLPDAVQNFTSYDAAAATAGRAPHIARRLARALASAEARKTFAATGIDR
ncbi:MAG: substrate-binding domain-containing protein [Burkholderiales bacterium]